METAFNQAMRKRLIIMRRRLFMNAAEKSWCPSHSNLLGGEGKSNNIADFVGNLGDWPEP